MNFALRYISAFIVILIVSVPTFGQFKGGEGHGHSQSLLSVFLDTDITHLYSASAGDGFSSHSLLSTLKGETVDIYNGESGDGFALTIQHIIPKGVVFHQYNGGHGDGMTVTAKYSDLDNSSFTFYEGGAGDGYSDNQSSSLMNGMLASLFNGGDGDGYDDKKQGFALSPLCNLILQIDDDPIPSGLYQADQINSGGKVRAPDNVIYKAENEINLESGFEVESNAIFEALIEFCLSLPANY